MLNSIYKHRKEISVLTVIGALFCVAIMLIPSMVTAQTTREVDVDELLDGDSIEFEFSSFAYATFSLYDVTDNATVLVRIENAEGNYPVSLQNGSGTPATFGNLAANITQNYLLFNLFNGSSYKLRFNVNDDMVVNFTLYNHSSYLDLPQQTQFYGYPKKTASGDDYLDFTITNGTAHAVTLSSAGSLTYTTYYDTTYVSNRTFSGSRSFYLSDQTTRMRVYGDYSTIFQFQITPATSYPSSGSSGTYYDNETVIIIVGPATYNDIVNIHYPATPMGNHTAFEGVILSYAVGATNISVQQANLNLTYHEDEIYVEDEVTPQQQQIGGRYRGSYTNASSGYVAFNTTFKRLHSYTLVDIDGDGYPITEITYQNVSVSNGTTVTTTFYGPWTETYYLGGGGIEDTDDDPSIPVTYKDLDFDTLGNEAEIFQFGTDPSDSDTDDDGLGDGFESTYWDYSDFETDLEWVDIYLYDLSTQEVYNLFRPDGDIDFDGIPNIIDDDSDGDGLTDGMEFNGMFLELLGGAPGWVYTDPFNPDTDLDGLTDGAEINGFHNIEVIPAMYAHDGLFWNSLNSTIDNTTMKYGAVLARDYQYIKVNFTIPLTGTYRIKLVTREYAQDYQNDTASERENTTEIDLYLNGNEPPLTPTKVSGFVYNTSDVNVTSNFTMDNVNVAGGHYNIYDLVDTQATYTVKVSLSASAPGKQIVVVDDILLQYQGLDPNDADVDNDGLGDGNMTVESSVRYFIGEATFGASPLLDDSDHDGLDDGAEVDLSNPTESYN